MNESVQSFPGAGTGALAVERNRVLRNTYALLALSMLPTAFGAWLGIQMSLAAILSPGIGLVVFLVGAFGFMFAIEKNKNRAAGVPILLAFTFFMGLMLSRMLAVVLGQANGGQLVMTAFAGTGVVFGMGRFLFIGAIILFVALIANFFIQSSALMLALSVMGMGIFSAFILYDLKRVRDGHETNYISATLGVYLSIYNVFQFLLAFLGIGNNE
jgi:modulator of FtsH protease